MKKTKKQKSQNKILHPVIIAINLVLLVFLGNSWNLSSAQTAPDSSATTDNSSSVTSSPSANPQPDQARQNLETQCLTQLNAFQDQEFEKYINFMENHFKNKSSTTSLLDDAIARYSEYKKALIQKLEEFENSNDKSVGANQITQFTFLSNCRDKVYGYIADGRKLLVLRAEATSSVKKATALLDKYKQINTELRQLNIEFLRLKGFLGTFSQKLPCYLRKQCNKG